MINKLLIVGILVFGCAAAGAVENKDKTYRWEDAKGRVYYSDLPPPAGARNISTTSKNGAAPDEELPYELQLAVKKFPVTIYVTMDCGGPCDSAKALLIARGVPHTLLDANRHDVNEKLTALTNGEPAVPLVEIGEIVVEGYEKGRWNAALDKAGYPRDAMISVTPNVPVGKNAAATGSDSSDGSDESESDETDAAEEQAELEDE